MLTLLQALYKYYTDVFAFTTVFELFLVISDCFSVSVALFRICIHMGSRVLKAYRNAYNTLNS